VGRANLFGSQIVTPKEEAIFILWGYLICLSARRASGGHERGKKRRLREAKKGLPNRPVSKSWGGGKRRKGEKWFRIRKKEIHEG